MFKLVLEKAEEPEIKLPTSIGSLKKQEISRKHLLLLYWLCQSLWLCGSQQTVENSSRDGNTWSTSWEICMQVKKQQKWTNEQWTGSKLGKKYIKAVYCYPAYLTNMQSTSCELLGWMKHKLESRLPGEIAITSDMQMTPPLWQKVKRNWGAPWWNWKKRAGLKFNIQKNKDHGIWFHHFRTNRWGNKGNSYRLYLFGLQNNYRWWL